MAEEKGTTTYRDMLDIIFADRNKAYGAYQLRRAYNQYLGRALGFGLLLILFIFALPYIMSAVRGLVPKEKPVDVIAERIRALGEKAPGSPSEFKKLSSITEGNSEFDSARMLKDLYDSNQAVLATLKKGLAAAEKASDASTADLLTQRITAHDKASWMLKSCLPANAGKLKTVA